MGPMALFDKSFVEMLNVDEAALFDFMYLSNICPIYFTEVLADLEKETPDDRTREKVVRDVAGKTPAVHSYPNLLHTTICLRELEGFRVPMDGRPMVAGGQPVRVDGKVGVYHATSPEMKAFNRWQEQRFLDVEREFARTWRNQLKTINLASAAALAQQALSISSEAKNLIDAYNIAKGIVFGERDRYHILKAAYSLLGMPSQRWPRVIQRWKADDGPPLWRFAPYVAHCLLVDTFFHVAVAKRLISPHRLSNRTDIAYLYYLPFANVFVSNDKLHQRTAPLFLRDDQLYVSGSDLKQDLQALVVHFTSLPDEVLQQGLFKFARDPPDDNRFLTTRFHRQFGFAPDTGPSLSPRENSKLAEELQAMIDGMEREAKPPTSPVDWAEAENADNVTIQRVVPQQWGRWRVVPPKAGGA